MLLVFVTPMAFQTAISNSWEPYVVVGGIFSFAFGLSTWPSRKGAFSDDSEWLDHRVNSLAYFGLCISSIVGVYNSLFGRGFRLDIGGLDLGTTGELSVRNVVVTVLTVVLAIFSGAMAKENHEQAEHYSDIHRKGFRRLASIFKNFDGFEPLPERPTVYIRVAQSQTAPTETTAVKVAPVDNRPLKTAPPAKAPAQPDTAAPVESAAPGRTTLGGTTTKNVIRKQKPFPGHPKSTRHGRWLDRKIAENPGGLLDRFVHSATGRRNNL